MLRRLASTLLLLLSAVPLAQAAPGDPIDLDSRIPHAWTSIVVNADGTAVESHEWSQVALKEEALEGVKSTDVTYSTSAQTAEIVAAYTLKADGRRLDVSKDSYQVTENRGNGKDAPIYSDYTTLSIVFPDVAVGDTVFLSYRLTQTDPLFPGKYSTSSTLSRSGAIDDLRVTIDWPASMPAKYEMHGLQAHRVEAAPKRKAVEWRWSNPHPVQGARENFSVRYFDQEIGYAFTTFASYADIARSYGDRAAPRAVTDRIRQLAAEIVGDAATPEAQTRALYEWVATHVTYAGNCIGVGAVVPRELSVVLDNRIGDCKDHATLLQALLSARGIASTQALINAGSLYRLPEVPVVSTVNHVITYIPSLDLYADSTSDSTPFGRLPFMDQGKPVLLVDGFRPDSRTPMDPPNVDELRAELAFAENGALTGSIAVTQVGSGAVSARAWARRLSLNDEHDMVRNNFRKQGRTGSGTFRKDDPKGLGDHFAYGLDFTVDRYLRLPGAGAIAVASPTGTQLVAGYLGDLTRTETVSDVTCRGGIARESFVVRFPERLQILSVPDDVDIGNDQLRYRATYRLEGATLRVEREIVDAAKGPICTPKQAAAHQAIAGGVLDDLQALVLFKLPKPAPDPESMKR